MLMTGTGFFLSDLRLNGTDGTRVMMIRVFYAEVQTKSGELAKYLTQICWSSWQSSYITLIPS